jgi:hypothetical protein
MTLQIDPRFPVVWRSPFALQVGLDDPVIIDDPTPLQLRLLGELVRGTSRTRLIVIAATAQQPPLAVTELLHLIRNRLLVPAPAQRWWVAGDSRLANRIRGTLSSLGQLDADDPELVVVCRDWTFDPAAAQHWLSGDIPQLPVISSDTSVTIGPLITPGRGPCLHCLHAYRTDRDPAWPAIACQLLDAPGAADGVLIERVTAEVARLLLTGAGQRDQRRQWVHTAGTSVPQTVARSAHPRCLCRDSVATERVSA